VSKGKQISYSRALSELEKIIVEIESEETDLDVLSEKVRRAAADQVVQGQVEKHGGRSEEGALGDR